MKPRLPWSRLSVWSVVEKQFYSRLTKLNLNFYVKVLFVADLYNTTEPQKQWRPSASVVAAAVVVSTSQAANKTLLEPNASGHTRCANTGLRKCDKQWTSIVLATLEIQFEL